MPLPRAIGGVERVEAGVREGSVAVAAAGGEAVSPCAGWARRGMPVGVLVASRTSGDP